MRLFIAEKPSLARAIADVLPAPRRRASDHIECGGGNIVAWCVGHILETAPPAHYSASFETWRLEDLPIVPEPWQLTPSKPALVTALARLLRNAESVVHAGDPDREGQLLVDEVLAFLNYQGPVQRLLVTDLNPDAVRKALAAIEPNSKYRPLSQAGLARQRADWLYGVNMTRLYTLLGRNGGYDGVLSVGRVQTPLLGLIVRRDLDIDRFVPVPYYALRATLQTETETFQADWVPTSAHTQHLDGDQRLLSREIAAAIQHKAQGQTGIVTQHSEEERSESPPLPYSLSDLQVEASRRHGFTAQQILDSCQRLYETHRLITYPRSDCSFLPTGHLDQAASVIAAIRLNAPALAPLLAGVDLSLRSRAWNDKKITAHHALIPTPHEAQPALSPIDAAVYDLISRRYLAQFYPSFTYVQTRVELELAEETWRVTGRRVLALGWKEIVSPGADGGDAAGNREPESEDHAELPALRRGQTLKASTVALLDKRTAPPKPFTDATLIHAMQNVAQFVADPAIKKVLKDTDGIGTEATRAGIIETLFERRYVTREKKAVRSTPAGRALVQNLPPIATTPDMTALWEAAMAAIAQGNKSLADFLAPVEAQLRELIAQGKTLNHLQIEPAHPCIRPDCDGSLRRLRGKQGHFWSCRKCRTTAEDKRGRPATANTPASSTSPRNASHHKARPAPSAHGKTH